MKSGKLDLETFKSDLKRFGIWLPYREEFLKEMFEQDFIEKSYKEVPSLTDFDPEKLKNKILPEKLLLHKESLFSCAQTLLRAGISGNKEKIIEAIKNEYELLNQKSLKKMIITKEDLDDFYRFLSENSCISKIKEFNLKITNILVAKTEQSSNVNPKYEYINYYDLERHFCEKFKAWPESFRNSFIQTVMIQKSDKDGEGRIVH